LFKKLNPLASKNRKDPVKVSVEQCVNDSIRIFEKIIERNNIIAEIQVEPKLFFRGWKQDLVIALANILENSTYWLEQKSSDGRKISVIAYVDGSSIVIRIQDTGPGINKEYIRSGVIFEPGISNKIGGGTGIGLPIAGEAISRNGGELRAIENDDGALFEIILPRLEE